MQFHSRMYKMRLKTIIVWLVACIFSYISDFTFSADLQLRSKKLKSTGRGKEAGSRNQQVPEFMIKLYKSVETGNNQLPIGNTVRSMTGKFSMSITLSITFIL